MREYNLHLARAALHGSAVIDVEADFETVSLHDRYSLENFDFRNAHWIFMREQADEEYHYWCRDPSCQK